MNSILITGSTGFVGSNLLDNLYEENKIYLILRKKNQVKNLIKKYKNINIIFYSKINELNKKLKDCRVDIVIHCATHYVKKHDYSDIKKLNDSNILLGNTLLENLKVMKVKKFINFSTIWEDYNSIKDNNYNLYSAYKKSFGIILNYYKKILSTIKFYNVMISDTFSKNDMRLKITAVLKNNYKKNKLTKIVSKNLVMNLLNVNDISNAINLIIKKKVTPGKYILKNNKNFKISEIVNKFNKKNVKKLRIKWMSNKTIKEKIYPYNKLKGWKPRHSNILDIVDSINT
jgi:nucleoside-diphosphate-sugar epimerase|tara:strand:+ start:1867 stop:2727 length:861 start_codon:yes stop_codon:yes gene_type:complete